VRRRPRRQFDRRSSGADCLSERTYWEYVAVEWMFGRQQAFKPENNRDRRDQSDELTDATARTTFPARL
ncbi:MAG: hypothetical protein QF805_11250, partial [Pirellulaceae bacterium]|nr:hypothetical protein [Pirellulaceae bacterium]